MLTRVFICLFKPVECVIVLLRCVASLLPYPVRYVIRLIISYMPLNCALMGLFELQAYPLETQNKLFAYCYKSKGDPNLDPSPIEKIGFPLVLFRPKYSGRHTRQFPLPKTRINTPSVLNPRFTPIFHLSQKLF